MQHKGLARWEFIGFFAYFSVVGAVTFTVLTNSRNAARKMSCQNNLKQIVLGFKQYVNDYDGRYPLVAITNVETMSGTPPYGWYDALQSYIGSPVNFCPECSSERPGSTSLTSAPGFTDYWFNSRLSGIKYGFDKFHKTLLPHTSLTICAGDGNDGSEDNNARYNRNSVPLNYAPARRHSGGANYAFIDGHVKWLIPEKLSTGPNDKSKPTLWPF